MDIVVVGAGSLGSLVGGLLARAHDVTLVGREPHVGSVASDGLHISGAIETTVHPDATTDVAGVDADLALVTVKAYDTAAVARQLADGDHDAALSLQNGLGNEDVLAEHLDCPVLAGTCTYGARLVEPGHVACTGVGEIALGPRDDGQSSPADDVCAAFDAADLHVTVADDMPRRLWEKLAVNAAINPVTALAGVENGAPADGPAADVARRAARETATVARETVGVDLADDGAVATVERVVSDTAANRSSMLQDVDAGRRTEIDAINGAVVRRARGGERGERHGDGEGGRNDEGPVDGDAPIDVPINETLAALVRAWETANGLR